MAPNRPPDNIVPFRKPSGGGGPRWQPPRWLKPWLWQTTVGWIVVANVVIYVVTVLVARGHGIVTNFPAAVPDRFGYLVPPKIPSEPWRLITATFLHGSILHVTMNMLIFWFIGPRLEAAFGRGRFAVLYLGAGLAGSIVSWIWHTIFPGTSLGASGAVSGIIGALFVLSYRAAGWHSPLTKQWLYWSIGMVVAGVFLSRSGVDNAAHIGGWLGGAGISWLFAGRRPWTASVERAALATGTLAVAVSFVLALTVGSTAFVALVPNDVLEAQERFTAGEWELAAAAAEKAAEAHRGDAYETHVLVLHAAALTELDRAEEAKAVLRKAERSDPTPLENARMAELWASLGDLDRARVLAYRAKLADSRFAPLHERLKALGEAKERGTGAAEDAPPDPAAEGSEEASDEGSGEGSVDGSGEDTAPAPEPT